MRNQAFLISSKYMYMSFLLLVNKIHIDDEHLILQAVAAKVNYWTFSAASGWWGGIMSYVILV